jgi:hypothetical protein
MNDELWSKYTSLWHYTTGAGMLGILQNSSLRATHIRYLNDIGEAKFFQQNYFPRLFKDHWTLAADKGKVSKNDVSALTEAVQESLMRGIFDNVDLFTASLSQPVSDADVDGMLSQWRGYGSDGGYALIFDTAKLRDALTCSGSRYSDASTCIGDMNYMTVDHPRAKYSKDVLAMEGRIVKALENMSDVNSLAVDSGNYFDDFINIACLTKHSGFAEENEVRIVVARPANEMLQYLMEGENEKPPRPLQFREYKGLLIPFINLYEADDCALGSPIKAIVVGPHLDGLRRAQSLRLLARQLNLDITVHESSLSYRGA